ncbi:MAG: hypothetical protein C4K60_09515 [Ideonella sp. MAG2]|nr:MAG: hypothetical protein C4K60_09515 [Ideonella sp. MAG2]
MARPERVRLGDLLIQEGLLTAEQLTQALEEQRRTGRKLGRMIVDNGLVTEEQVSQALAKQLRMPFLDVSGRTLRPELVKLLPEVQARRLRAAVLEDTGSIVPSWAMPPSPPPSTRAAAVAVATTPATAAARGSTNLWK